MLDDLDDLDDLVVVVEMLARDSASIGSSATTG